VKDALAVGLNRVGDGTVRSGAVGGLLAVA